VGDERVMEVGGLREAEQPLEKPLGWRRGPQILSSHDQRHAGLGIVDDACEVIGRRGVLAGQDGVADLLTAAFEAGAVLFRPIRQAGQRNRPLRIEAPAMRDVGTALGIVGKAPAGTGIAASGIAVGRGQRLGDVRARAETGIDEPLSLELLQRLGIARGPFRLDYRLSVGLETEPGQVLEDAIDELRPAAARVQILDPQEEPTPAGACMGMAERRRKGVTQVKAPGWRRRKTCDLQDSLPAKGDHGDS
jgi:hypothetical protein